MYIVLHCVLCGQSDCVMVCVSLFGVRIDDRLRTLLQPETAERLIAERLKGWKKSKEAIMLFMLGVDLDKLKAFLQPRLVMLAVELSPVVRFCYLFCVFCCCWYCYCCFAVIRAGAL